ncbi:hypothetical protein [Pectinatus frisingensis]|uniref:hypothetical protein n=1 Tax=Pectinatus frisingensis TaxID=865 RepID=UPI0018C6A354|nr:hypothetical protein [Pectinatus frisingensis]
MTPRDIMNKIRMAAEIEDNSGVKYSNYQLIDAINSVLNIIYNAISHTSSTILTQSQKINLTNSAGKVPDDFLSVIDVQKSVGDRQISLQSRSQSQEVDPWSYKIIGNQIYSQNDVLTILYEPYFDDISINDIDTDLVLPSYFREVIKKYAVMTLTGGVNTKDSTLVEQVTSDVYDLTSSRELSNIKPALPWRI